MSGENEDMERSNCGSVGYNIQDIFWQILRATGNILRQVFLSLSETWSQNLVTAFPNFPTTRQPQDFNTAQRSCMSALIYLSVWFHYSCSLLPETKHHSSLFPHWSGFKFLVAKAACTLSIVFLERPLFLSGGVHSIINFGILSSDILLKWPYHCSLFFSMMSCFPFTSS